MPTLIGRVLPTENRYRLEYPRMRTKSRKPHGRCGFILETLSMMMGSGRRACQAQNIHSTDLIAFQSFGVSPSGVSPEIVSRDCRALTHSVRRLRHNEFHRPR